MATSETDFDVLRRLNVNTVDETDPRRVVLHDDRAGTRAVTEEPDTAHQCAVGDSRRSKDDTGAGRKISRLVNFLEVLDAHRPAALFVLGLADHQPRKDLAVETAHSRRREDAFRCAAGPHHRMYTRPDDG